MVSRPPIVDKIIAKYSIPERLYVDNGGAFTSKAVLSSLTDLGIEVHFGTPYSTKAKRLERHFVDLTEVDLDELGA